MSNATEITIPWPKVVKGEPKLSKLLKVIESTSNVPKNILESSSRKTKALLSGVL